MAARQPRRPGSSASKTTGHAARGTGGPPSPVAEQSLLAAGPQTPAELMADIKEGLYVTELIGMGVNGVTGDYSRGAAGFMIRDGALAEPVAEITVAGQSAGDVRPPDPGQRPPLQARHGCSDHSSRRNDSSGSLTFARPPICRANTIAADFTGKHAPCAAFVLAAFAALAVAWHRAWPTRARAAAARWAAAVPDLVGAAADQHGAVSAQPIQRSMTPNTPSVSGLCRARLRRAGLRGKRSAFMSGLLGGLIGAGIGGLLFGHGLFGGMSGGSAASSASCCKSS